MIPRILHYSEQHPIAPLLQVSVNGIPQQFVISYNCDTGTVERYERTPHDEFVMSHLRPEWMTETVRGDVTVTLT